MRKRILGIFSCVKVMVRKMLLRKEEIYDKHDQAHCGLILIWLVKLVYQLATKVCAVKELDQEPGPPTNTPPIAIYTQWGEGGSSSTVVGKACTVLNMSKSLVKVEHQEELHNETMMNANSVTLWNKFQLGIQVRWSDQGLMLRDRILWALPEWRPMNSIKFKSNLCSRIN